MKKLYLDETPALVRCALVEDGQLTELAIENKRQVSLVGDIYLARVTNILPARFAFLDIGMEKSAFLYLNDKKESRFLNEEKNGRISISLKKGDEIPVQVIKDPKGDKGACVTSELSFSGRHVVLLENPAGEIGISKRILASHERERLKSIVRTALPEGFSAIIRTEAEGADAKPLEEELALLLSRYRVVAQNSRYQKAPAVLLKENNLVYKTLDRLFRSDVSEIFVETPAMAADAEQYFKQLYLAPPCKVHLHDGSGPLFKAHLLEVQIEKALRKKVWLKSGGFLMIEQTEACVAIDVNSGKYIDGKDHSKTVLTTNLEAVTEIVSQIRLRNLSGMILIDFINMHHEADQKAVYEKLKEESLKDRAGIHIAGVIGLDVVLLTRKKTYETLENLMTKLCPCCRGTGRIKEEHPCQN